MSNQNKIEQATTWATKRQKMGADQREEGRLTSIAIRRRLMRDFGLNTAEAAEVARTARENAVAGL